MVVAPQSLSPAMMVVDLPVAFANAACTASEPTPRQSCSTITRCRCMEEAVAVNEWLRATRSHEGLRRRIPAHFEERHRRIQELSGDHGSVWRPKVAGLPAGRRRRPLQRTVRYVSGRFDRVYPTSAWPACSRRVVAAASPLPTSRTPCCVGARPSR